MSEERPKSPPEPRPTKKRARRRLKGKTLLLAAAGIASVAYSGCIFTSGNLVAPPPVDAGPDSGPPPAEDAGPDSGPPSEDAGLAEDAGSAAEDSGPPSEDAGSGA